MADDTQEPQKTPEPPEHESNLMRELSKIPDGHECVPRPLYADNRKGPIKPRLNTGNWLDEQKNLRSHLLVNIGPCNQAEN